MTITTERSALTGTWSLDPSHTRIGFAAKHAMVATVRGSFGVFDGTLVLDGDVPANSSATVTIDAASFESGNKDRDAHVRGADFLDVESFSTLTFTSSEVRPNGNDFVLVGNLTIKDVTQPVEIAVESEGVVTDPFGSTRAGFSGTATINRKDFGLTWNVALEAGGILVGDRVKITLDVSAVKQS
ncbi:MAG TPA: YceI family protein [Candidatus Limnocylindria bacterium]|nr:YceI family protein [Candidatus Limnocylindria bacterium]